MVKNTGIKKQFLKTHNFEANRTFIEKGRKLLTLISNHFILKFYLKIFMSDKIY